VDLIGPWVVQVHGNPYEFDALTVINTVTNLVELIRVDKKPQTLLQESTHNVGYHVTSGHKDVYTIQEGNLLRFLGLPCGVGSVGAEFIPVVAIVVDEVCDLTESLVQDGVLELATATATAKAFELSMATARQ
jgi:hypothetical protein